MWRFGIGTKPPSPKRPKTDTERKAKALEYEGTKRKRKVQDDWLSKFTWLTVKHRYSDQETMFCKVCTDQDPNGSGTFITGCKNLRLETITVHNATASHKCNVKKFNAQHSIPGTSPTLTDAQLCMQQLNKSVFDRLCILFKTAHAMAKHGRPYSDFSWMNALDESKGLNIGNTYRNDKRAREFVTAISDSRRVAIKSNFDQCKYFSLISDGATDTSHTEAEVCYIKFAIQGKIHTYFVGIKNVPKADAENISKAIISMLDECLGDEWAVKVVGTATDGASVMLGKKNGVVVKIKNYTNRPFIFIMHCSCHRLELAYKDACISVPIYKKIELFLLNVYLFYRNSPLQRSNLKSSFAVHDRKPLMPLRAGGTRWLSHLSRALRNLITGFGPIVTHLTQLQAESGKEVAAKARNFLAVLKSQSNVYFMHFLWDVVNCLAHVSLTFQAKESTVADIHEEITAAKEIIKTYGKSEGPMLSKVSGQDTFDGITLTGNLTSFNSGRQKIVANLITHLDSRFESNIDVVKSTSIARLGTYPSKISDFPEFGNADVEVLLNVFRPALMSSGVAADEVLPSWIRFKVLLYSNFPDVKLASWEEINRRLRARCAPVLDLIDLILSLPSSSAEAERGFSAMKIIKTDWRSRLNDQHLTDIMTVSLETPDVAEFDPSDAVNHWYNSGIRKRRPNFMQDDEATTSAAANPVADTDNEFALGFDRIEQFQNFIKEVEPDQNETDYNSDYCSGDSDFDESYEYELLKKSISPDN